MRFGRDRLLVDLFHVKQIGASVLSAEKTILYLWKERMHMTAEKAKRSLLCACRLARLFVT